MNFSTMGVQKTLPLPWSVILGLVAGLLPDARAQNTPPSVTVQPQSQAVLVGTNVMFSVAASGTLPLSYQWRKDGTHLLDGGSISGAATASLALSNVQPPDAGSYSLLVTNPYGSATSVVAVLSVDFLYTFSTLAGLAGTSGTNDGIGTAARFGSPPGLGVDQTRNLYVADSGNQTIRKTTPAGMVTTFAGSAGQPGTNDGPGRQARFSTPHDVGSDPSGNVFVADYANHTIRKITPVGMVSTFAGQAGMAGTNDGTGADAKFNGPAYLAVDSDGNVYVADHSNHAIRKITPFGAVTTLAGRPGTSGYADATGSIARFNGPEGLVIDRDGNIYAGDRYNHAIRKITPTGVVTTFAGSTNRIIGSTDGVGSAARFNNPHGVALDSAGNLYVSDMQNQLIRRVTPDRRVSTIGGLAVTSGSSDGTASAARFNLPRDVVVDRNDILYVADFQNHTIRRGLPVGPVRILLDPQSQTVTAGSTVAFSITATGSPPPSFRWQFNGTTLPGATHATLSLDAVNAAHTGSYRCIVSNFTGSATSQVAVLSVRPGPGYLRPLTNIVINEVLALTELPFLDAIELYNPTTQAVDLGGWFLSNSETDLKKYRVPPGTVLPAGGYWVFDESDFGPNPGPYSGFTLDGVHGDRVCLSQGNAQGNLTGYGTSVALGPAETGVSLGRYVTNVGEEEFVAQTAMTLGAPNAGPRVGPVVVTEVMYHPVSGLGSNAVENADEEFIELLNASPSTLPLFDPAYPTNRWKLAGAVEYVFPISVMLPPGGLLLVVPFDPVNNPTALANFRTKYAVSPSVPILGPWSGQLSNSIASVELYKPDAPLTSPPEAGFVPDILVDRVQYRNAAPWPAEADGTGASLQRLNALAYGNDPVNWIAATPTAGGPTPSSVPPRLVAQPVDQLAVAGATAVFRVMATGTGPLSYQWRQDDANLMDGGRISGATSSFLTLSNVQTTDAGPYHVVVSNAYGAVTSTVVTLAVLGPPVVLVNGQPVAGNAVSVAGPATVEVQTGLPDGWLLYTLDGSDPDSGLLYLGPFTVSESVTVRAVVFLADFSAWVEAEPVVISFLEPPGILAQPQSQIVPAGATASFEVTARGTEPLGYQWRFNGAALLNATNPVLALSNVQIFQAGTYAALVSNSVGAVTSAVALLTVSQPPAFTQQPVGTNVMIGDSVTFRATATGTPPLRYQWRKNGANIAGGTNPTFTIPSVQSSDGGIYTVVVANEAGTVVSQPVQLGILVPVVPPGDNFDPGVALVGTEGYASGTNLFATREPGEPQHAGRPGTNSVWYTWTAPANGIATFRTVGSTFDTLLAVYTGPSVSNLTEVASDEDRGGFFTSEVRFNAVAGTEYQIAIDGFVGAQGNFLLHWSFEDTPSQLPVIISQPTSGTVRPGDSFTFNVTATGSNLSYHWLFFGELIPGATSSSYTISSVQPQHVGTYTVQVSSGTNVVTSQPAVLEIGPLAGVQSQDKPENLLESAGGGGSFMKGPSKAGATSASTVPVTIPVAAGTIDSQVLNTTGSSLQPIETNACGAIGGASRWLGLRPQVDGTMIVDSVGSAFRTVLTVYRAPAVYADEFGFWSSLVFRTCTNRTPGCGCSRLLFNVRAGTNYLVSVDGVDGATGIAQLNWALGRAPEVLTNGLGNATVRLGGSLSWSVAVADAIPPPTFHWQRDGVDLPGATSGMLTLDHVQPSDAGEYFVVVSNVIGSVRQYVGRLTVDPATSIQIDSSFDAGLEGWGVAGAGATVSFDANNGHPGGCVTAVGAAAQWWYWQAPAAFLGDRSGAYNGWLEYDLRQATTSAYDDTQPDVVLLGAGQRLVGRTRHIATTGWVRYRVSLIESAWQEGDVNGPAASREELRRVLSALTGLEIRANLSVDQTSSALDNVAWVGPTPVQLTVCRGPSQGLVVAWPAWAASYVLEGSVDLATGWTPLDAARTVAGEVVTVTVPTTDGHSFFRLRRPGSTGP